MTALLLGACMPIVHRMTGTLSDCCAGTGAYYHAVAPACFVTDDRARGAADRTANRRASTLIQICARR